MRGKSLIKSRPRPLQASSLRDPFISQSNISREQKRKLDELEEKDDKREAERERRDRFERVRRNIIPPFATSIPHCTALIMSNNETSRSLNQAEVRADVFESSNLERDSRFAPEIMSLAISAPVEMFTLQLLAAPESAGEERHCAHRYMCTNGAYIHIYSRPFKPLYLGQIERPRGKEEFVSVVSNLFQPRTDSTVTMPGIVIMIAGQETARFPCSWIFNGTFGIARLLIFMVPFLFPGELRRLRDKERLEKSFARGWGRKNCILFSLYTVIFRIFLSWRLLKLRSIIISTRDERFRLD